MDQEPASDPNNVKILGDAKLTKKEKIRRAAIALAVCTLLSIIGAAIPKVAFVLVVAMPVGFGLIIYLVLQGYSTITKAENQSDEKWRAARMESIAAKEKEAEAPKETVTYR